MAIGFTASERYSGPRLSLGVDGAAGSGDDGMVALAAANRRIVFRLQLICSCIHTCAYAYAERLQGNCCYLSTVAIESTRRIDVYTDW